MSDVMNGGSPSVLRGLNLRQTLRHVRSDGPVSKADLIRLTGLSRPTINDVVSQLLGANLIERIDADEVLPRRAGSVRDLFVFNAKKGFLLGVDIGARKTVILLSDLAGEVVARSRIDSGEGLGSTFAVNAVREEIARLLYETGIGSSQLWHGAVCTPGIVDPETGRLSLAPQLPALNGREVGGLLGLECPTSIENEMRTAVLGESWRGAGKSQDNIVYVGVGVGVGAAMMLRGELYRGFTGAAGEIGYLNLRGGAHKVSVGELGPLESFAGANAYAERGLDAAKRNPGSFIAGLLDTDDGVTPETISHAAAQGDPVALELIEEEASYIAEVLATLSIILDPELVILGGGISQAGDLLLEPVRRILKDLVPSEPPRVVQGALGDEAAALGAIRQAMTESDRVIESELTGGEWL